jgi:hypothetical protein
VYYMGYIAPPMGIITEESKTYLTEDDKSAIPAQNLDEESKIDFQQQNLVTIQEITPVKTPKLKPLRTKRKVLFYNNHHRMNHQLSKNQSVKKKTKKELPQ